MLAPGAFVIQTDGSLVSLGEEAGLPEEPGAVGVVARQVSPLVLRGRGRSASGQMSGGSRNQLRAL